MKKGDINWFMVMLIFALVAGVAMFAIIRLQLTRSIEPVEDIHSGISADSDGDGVKDIFDRCKCDPVGRNPLFTGCPDSVKVNGAPELGAKPPCPQDDSSKEK